MSDEVGFGLADKDKIFLEIDTIILMGRTSISEVPKMASLQSPYNVKLEMKLIF